MKTKSAYICWLLFGLCAAQVQAQENSTPDNAKKSVETWPLQTKSSPRTTGDPKQEKSALPKTSVRPGKPEKAPAVPAAEALRPVEDGKWVITVPWKLAEADKVHGAPESVAQPALDTANWHDATVPGTVLATLINQGIYPDPYFGMNNLAIPENLNKQDYWYRCEFTAPAAVRHATLVFQGINYRAQVWLNGSRLGEIKGAFMRGIFDTGSLLKPGSVNVLAVRVSPPPNPGTPHEQSLSGPGGNGGSMCKDGPTFFCSEGWDWIPGIRDRCTGLWQDVVLHEHGPIRIGDAHVITDLPLPDVSRADVTVQAELTNQSDQPQAGVWKGEFEGVTFEKQVTIPPRSTQTVSAAPAEFPQLVVKNPRLWWPNGYGRPELYQARLSFVDTGGKVSDIQPVRFGIREVSYDLTAVDGKKTPQRYEFFPTAAGQMEVIDHRHRAIVKSAKGWVPSLAEGAENSPALKSLENDATGSSLVIRINGKRIPVRGGNWGMDDALKRISRDRLEPYIRLQRDANFNTIRNWCGQSTSQVFFELCDEYGILVWNEFWLTTQDYNLEPTDADLFLANAADSIKRFRCHPSIILWCGRNEGVPPPALNEGLAALIRQQDGTRLYQPNSRDINLLFSGPWRYEEPSAYFTRLGKGFTTEVGLPCVPTADGMRAMLPESDSWPINDQWAYHDWHQEGNGDTKPFMEAMKREFGEAKDLEDFCRKSQMLNYVSHRALFEGMNALLWKPATGRLMWMSHPSWPSTVWQLYAHDYEAAGAYFGIKKACEPVHVQMNLPDFTVAVVNTTLAPLGQAKVTSTVYDEKGMEQATKTETVDAPANTTVSAFKVPEGGGALRFVKLQLHDAAGAVVSENFYWAPSGDAGHQAMQKMAPAAVEGTARVVAGAKDPAVEVELSNSSSTLALLVAVTLRNAGTGTRVLPAYASDNYITLLPGDKRRLTIAYPAKAAPDALQVTCEGWNVPRVTLPVSKP
jgi:beta-galactosidase/beta-glucuronidase